jgi:hypothetical protein
LLIRSSMQSSSLLFVNATVRDQVSGNPACFILRDEMVMALPRQQNIIFGDSLSICNLFSMLSHFCLIFVGLVSLSAFRTAIGWCKIAFKDVDKIYPHKSQAHVLMGSTT